MYCGIYWNDWQKMPTRLYLLFLTLAWPSSDSTGDPSPFLCFPQEYLPMTITTTVLRQNETTASKRSSRLMPSFATCLYPSITSKSLRIPEQPFLAFHQHNTSLVFSLLLFEFLLSRKSNAPLRTVFVFLFLFFFFSLQLSQGFHSPLVLFCHWFQRQSKHPITLPCTFYVLFLFFSLLLCIYFCLSSIYYTNVHLKLTQF